MASFFKCLLFKLAILSLTLSTYMKKVDVIVCTSSHRSARVEAGGSLALLILQVQ